MIRALTIAAILGMSVPATADTACRPVLSPVQTCTADHGYWIVLSPIGVIDHSRRLVSISGPNAIVVSEPVPVGDISTPWGLQDWALSWHATSQRIDTDALTVLDRQPQTINGAPWMTLGFSSDLNGATYTYLSTVGVAQNQRVQLVTYVNDTATVSDQHLADHARFLSTIRFEG